MKTTGTFTLEIQLKVDGLYLPELPAKWPSKGNETGDPAEPEVIEVGSITQFAIIEPRFDKLSGRTQYVETNLLDHLLKYIPQEELQRIFLGTPYVNELAEDSLRESVME